LKKTCFFKSEIRMDLVNMFFEVAEGWYTRAFVALCL